MVRYRTPLLPLTYLIESILYLGSTREGVRVGAGKGRDTFKAYHRYEAGYRRETAWAKEIQRERVRAHECGFGNTKGSIVVLGSINV